MYLIIFYVIVVITMLLFYFLTTEKSFVKDIVAIISGMTLAFGLLNYTNTDRQRQITEKQINNENYMNSVSGVFNKIDNLYLENKNELDNLYYEFYAFNNFPKNKDTQINQNIITGPEYIAINIILGYFYNIFIVHPEIFTKVYFRNKILNYTNSNKFKKVFAYNKGNYSENFIRFLDEQKIISDKELHVESIYIPKVK